RRQRARVEAGGRLRRIPGPELLDDRLRVDACPGIGGELLHRRRAAEPFRGRAELVEQLVVRVALPDRRLEPRQLLGIDPRERVEATLPGHANNGRSSWRNRKYARASSNDGVRPRYETATACRSG